MSTTFPDDFAFDDLPEAEEAPRQRPDTAQIEAAVLSIVMAFPDAYDAVADRLEPCHFAVAMHRQVFVELRRQISSGKGCDLVTVAHALGEDRYTLVELHAVLTCHDHSPRALGRMVDVLIDRHKGRELHRLSVKLSESAFDTVTPAQERIDMAMAELAKLDGATTSEDWVGPEVAAMAHLELIDRREQGENHGIPTGLIDLDDLLDGGLQRGNLVIIGARPSMGKTALGMTIGLHVAQHHAVGFVSMEMPHADLRDRMFAILGRIPLPHLKRPKLHGLDYGRVLEAVDKAKRLRFFVSDKSGQNILHIRSRARQIRRKHGLDVLVVDYLGLMDGLDKKQARAYQIEEITKGLKSLAKELDIAVIALAQVNRGVAERASNIPALSDLRDSGAIEQDADVVAFIHRQIVAKPDAGPEFAPHALLRVAKNRQGRTGDVHLHYHGEATRFDAWAGQPPSVAGAVKQTPKRGFTHEDF